MNNEASWKAEDHPFYEDPNNPHLGGYRIGGDIATTYCDLWTWLVNDYGVSSVVDVGCGDGVAVDFFEALLPGGVIGIEGIPQKQENILLHDYTKGPKTMGTQFDICWCVEMVEHLEERFLPNLLETFKCAKTVIITHAFPGQAGYHHVLCRTPHYWIGAMSAIGYRLDEGLTKSCREQAAKNTSQWNHFVRSGMAFIRYA